MKKLYKKPHVTVCIIKENLMDVITPGSPTDDFAKEANSFEEDDDEVTLPIDKNIWEDDEE